MVFSPLCGGQVRLAVVHSTVRIQLLLSGINATYNYIMAQRHEANEKLSRKLKLD